MLLGALAIVVLVPASSLAVYRVLPPPFTPLMVIRLVQGEGLEKDWTSLADISPHVVAAVVAAEDSRFCRHFGFDWQALADAIDGYRAGDGLRGASTISMQTAKNLFLWPDRSFVRKGLEAYLTVLLEALVPKRRILELYLNVAEWGPGLYGAEAAARKHFGKPAAKVTRREAALLAAVLPNPRRWSAGEPTGYIARRAGTITMRARQLGPLLDCTE